ncbi:serine protease snake [Bicyclus anynana]|uniref:Serine protease snake n=1 Tax=Bicyclus anynana TaxID=110368 RepID=A0A6J1P1F2_BICAN|nr:serine protease snake [Bicyclus anynana]
MKWFALSIVFLVAVQHGISLKEGEGCVIRHTDSSGLCIRGSKCMTALNDYQRNGIPPTLCSEYRFPFLVCCTGVTLEDIIPVLDTRRVSERKCDEYKQIPQTKRTVTAQACDYDELDVAGELATQWEFPHVVALGWGNKVDSNSFQSAGSLISSRFVLTRAYFSKLINAAPTIVRFGGLEIDVPSSKENTGSIDVQTQAIYFHPEYSFPMRYNDIALVEMKADVDFGIIRPACLWSNPDFPEYSKPIITSWPAVDPSYSERRLLKKTPRRLLDSDTCNETLKDYFDFYWKGVADEQLCTGHVREGSSCERVNGSPLQLVSYEYTNQCIFHVLGVMVSDCSMFTRVSSHLDWIEKVVWPGE